jgi:hypothetical protein
LKSAEIYDPQTGIWSPAPDMSTARANHALLTLGNGLVLAVGGEFSATRSRAEVYDSSSNRWLAAGLLAGDHDDHAVALANGWVLAPADHYDSQVAEIYRPALALARTDFNADGGWTSSSRMLDSLARRVGERDWRRRILRDIRILADLAKVAGLRSGMEFRQASAVSSCGKCAARIERAPAAPRARA